MTEQLTIDHKCIKIGKLIVTIRPITSDDREIEADFVRNLSAQSKHDRFLEGIRELSPSMLTTLCDIDQVNSMAYIATIQQLGNEKQIGVCRYAIASKPDEREMAVTVSDEFQHHGIATNLTNELIAYARANGIKRLYSIDLYSNFKMRELAKSLGMNVAPDLDDPKQVIYSLLLQGKS